MSDRARVPFALIGVLLLVTSGTVAVTQHKSAVGEPEVDRAMDRLTAESHSALRASVREAAREAVRRPLQRPANSTVGDAINETRAFEDGLRLRIYLAARSNLADVSDRRRGVNLSASLPPIDDESDVAAAIDRIGVERGGSDGHQIRVTVQGLAFQAVRDGRVVGETRSDPTVVVDTPVLVVHDRVERFEERLDAYVGQPGLASRLTGLLYPIAWARGYAQFGGRPIENVVSNRHVSLVANGAVLAEQRAAFGASDPVGRQVYAATLGEAAVTELVADSESRTLERLDRFRETTGLDRIGDDALTHLEPDSEAPRPADRVTVEIGETADLGYLRSARALNETLDASYAPQVRVRADVETIDRRTVDTHDPVPGGSFERARTVYRTTVSNRSGSPPPSADGWHRLAGYSHTVVVEEHTIHRWEITENRSTTTSSTDRIRKAVDLVAEGNHVVGPAPPDRIDSVHQRGGPFDGPNLVDARERLLEAGVEARGGAEELASRAALGRLDSGPRAAQAPRPRELAAWARPDIAPLRREIRAISVEVPRGEIASFRANVPEMLADRLRNRRAELIDAPGSYDSVARRARVGVRAEYVDRVLGMLERRAEAHRNGRDGLDDALNTTSDRGQAVLADGYDARGTTGPAGGDGPRMVVDTSPSYLTVQPVGHDAVPAIPAGQQEHPLVVRNHNGFGLPAAGVLEALFGLLDGSETTSLRTAAQVLAVTDDVDLDRESPPNPAPGLRQEVGRTNAWVAAALESVLARRGLGTQSEREAAVAAALEGWEDRATRARAIANGSVASAVHEKALERWPAVLDTTRKRELLAIELRFAASETRSSDVFQPTLDAVNGTANHVRERLGYVDDVARDRLIETSQRRAAALAARFPKGVPVLPGPGTWYATVNVWQVDVRGSYARFAVRVRHGAPDVAPPDLTYVRENRTVRLDVDGDGRRERLGHNRRIAFEAETAIGVAVPPRPRGVGDVGERDERSPGWPDPGPVPHNGTNAR